jgi:hypothetical protein
VAVVVVEPPVLAVVDLAHLPVLALAQVVAHRAQLPRLARLLLLLLLLLLARAHQAVRSVVAAPAQGLVAADVVAAPAVPLEHLLSRQSCSAAMAESSP